MKITAALTLSVLEILSSNVLATNERTAPGISYLRRQRRAAGLFSATETDLVTADAKSNGNANGNGNGNKATEAPPASTTTTTAAPEVGDGNGNGNAGGNGNGKGQQETTTMMTTTTGTTVNSGTTTISGDTITTTTVPETTTTMEPYESLTTTTTEAPNGNGNGNGGKGGNGGQGGSGGSGKEGGKTKGNQGAATGKNAHGYGYKEPEPSFTYNIPTPNGPFDVSSEHLIHGDDITISFDIASLAKYSSSHNITLVEDWTVGIFMRMGHPQGGDQAPLTALKPELVYGGNGVEGTVTFSKDVVADMTGEAATWPLSLGDFGNGYDIWLLDDEGAEVMGPTMFVVEETAEQKAAVEAAEKKKPAKAGMMKGNGKKKAYGGDEVKNGSGNGSAGKGKMILGASPALATYTLTTDVFTYSPSDTVTVEYDVGGFFNPAWTVGIYAKMANPQGGDLPPIISKPLTATGVATFEVSSFFDPNLHGTGYDVWILSKHGDGVAGPVTFEVPTTE